MTTRNTWFTFHKVSGTYSAFTCGAGVLLPPLSIGPLPSCTIGAVSPAQTGLQSFNLQRCDKVYWLRQHVEDSTRLNPITSQMIQSQLGEIPDLCQDIAVPPHNHISPLYIIYTVIYLSDPDSVHENLPQHLDSC